VVTNPTNSGHVVTFNNGFRVATGDFIVRLDADDLLTPGSLARSAALFAAFPSVGLVYGRPRHFAGDWPPAPVVGEIGWTVWSGQDWIAERCRRAVNCITTPEAAVRASVMRDVGGLDTSLKFAQDMEMWLRVAAVSDVGWIKGADQALHREHPASMSVTAGAGSLTDLRERRAVFQVLFQRMGGHISYAAELRDTALRGLAREALGEACQAYNRGAVRVTPVEELIVFAQQTWPKYEQLPEFRALQRRRRVGAAVSPFVPGFFAAAVKRRVASELGYARWLASGV
jgi:glycosyltransferase involved in cell wall biosynthesis